MPDKERVTTARSLSENCHSRPDRESSLLLKPLKHWIPAGVYPVLRYGAGMTLQGKMPVVGQTPRLSFIRYPASSIWHPASIPPEERYVQGILGGVTLVLDLFKLEGKVALVTGGGRGLGKAMAKALAEAGADIIIVSRQLKNLEETSQEIRTLGRRALPIAADLSKDEEIKKVTSQALNFLGKVDILVNNAGLGMMKPVLEMTVEDWDNVIDLNLRAIFLCSKSIGAHMVKRGEGKIINISSMYAFIGAQNMTPYVASKGGVMQLTKALALEWARYNVQVNAICPGYFLTDVNRDLFETEKGKDIVRYKIPLRRLGDPSELGGLVVYLASAASSYVTGAAFVIDAGHSIM